MLPVPVAFRTVPHRGRGTRASSVVSVCLCVCDRCVVCFLTQTNLASCIPYPLGPPRLASPLSLLLHCYFLRRVPSAAPGLCPRLFFHFFTFQSSNRETPSQPLWIQCNPSVPHAKTIFAHSIELHPFSSPLTHTCTIQLPIYQHPRNAFSQLFYTHAHLCSPSSIMHGVSMHAFSTVTIGKTMHDMYVAVAWNSINPCAAVALPMQHPRCVTQHHCFKQRRPHQHHPSHIGDPATISCNHTRKGRRSKFLMSHCALLPEPRRLLVTSQLFKNFNVLMYFHFSSEKALQVEHVGYSAPNLKRNCITVCTVSPTVYN